MPLDEFGLIGRYFQCAALEQAGDQSAVVLGIGDDAAVLQPASGCQWVISTDSLVQGVHFPDYYHPADLGYRALAVAVSDLAAMAARPVGFTLALTLPRMDEHWLAGFSAGLAACAAEHRINLIGGDTTRGPLNIGISVFGEVRTGQALRRDGAQPGDLLCVTGPLGDGAAGLAVVLDQDLPVALSAAERDYLRARFWRPQIHCERAQTLAGVASAGLDISDGLLQDAGHLARCSGVAVHIQSTALPRSPALQAWPQAQQREWMLRGGDDYVLLFSLPPEHLSLLGPSQHCGWSVAVIGEVAGGAGVWLDQQHVTGSAGYQHFTESSHD